LGTGAGRLLALLKEARPRAEFVGLDFSQTMLGELQKRFRSDPSVTVVEHNFEHPLPSIGRFDAVISSFAIHHLVHERKRSLYAEVFGILNPAGGFYNLELVSAPSPKLHLQTQLTWLLEIGFADVDCHWEWREFALFGGVK
jgi:tRNA (cmo5U34)-methyltransferase